MRVLGECSVRQPGTEPVGPDSFAVAASRLALVGWGGAGEALGELFSLASIPWRLACEAPKLPLCQEGVVHPDRLRRFTYLQPDLSHLGLYMFSLFSNIRTPWVPRFDLYQVAVGWSITPLPPAGPGVRRASHGGYCLR